MDLNTVRFEQNLSSMGEDFIQKAKACLGTKDEEHDAPEWEIDCMTVAIVSTPLFYQVVIFEDDKSWTLAHLPLSTIPTEVRDGSLVPDQELSQLCVFHLDALDWEEVEVALKAIESYGLSPETIAYISGENRPYIEPQSIEEFFGSLED